MHSRGQRPRKPYPKNIDPAEVALSLQHASARPFRVEPKLGSFRYRGRCPRLFTGIPLRG